MSKGYYSALASVSGLWPWDAEAGHRDSARWTRPDGTEVEVTCVHAGECICAWGDSVYVGEVVHCVRPRPERRAGFNAFWMPERPWR